MHGVRRIHSPGVFAAANHRNQDGYPRRTTIAPHNRPLTRRDHLMHKDIQDVCENRSSEECALKNICGYPHVNVTSGNRQHDRHNAVSDCYTPASRAAAAARPKCRRRRHLMDGSYLLSGETLPDCG